MLQIGRTTILDFIICVLKKEKRRLPSYATQAYHSLQCPMRKSAPIARTLDIVYLCSLSCRGGSSSSD